MSTFRPQPTRRFQMTNGVVTFHGQVRNSFVESQLAGVEEVTTQQPGQGERPPERPARWWDRPVRTFSSVASSSGIGMLWWPSPLDSVPRKDRGARSA